MGGSGVRIAASRACRIIGDSHRNGRAGVVGWRDPRDQEEVGEAISGGCAPVSLLMLVHNEAPVIERVVRDYHREVIDRLPGSEFILVEDGSRDGTTEILERLRGELGLTVIHRDERRGYTAALRDGLSIPKHDLVFFSDADGQHDPRDFWKLANRVRTADLVIGVKSPRRDPWYRLAISRVFNALIAAMFGLRLSDINSGFRLMTRRLVDDLLRDEWRLRACIASELTIRAHDKGYAIAEVPVRHLSRPFGGSKGLPLSRIPRAVVHIVRELLVLRRLQRAGRLDGRPRP